MVDRGGRVTSRLTVRGAAYAAYLRHDRQGVIIVIARRCIVRKRTSRARPLWLPSHLAPTCSVGDSLLPAISCRPTPAWSSCRRRRTRLQVGAKVLMIASAPTLFPATDASSDKDAE